MKATGIVRRVDDLGRVIIPKEVRRILGISEGTPLEIFFGDEKVIFKKYDTTGDLRKRLNEMKDAFYECRQSLDPDSENKIQECIRNLEETLK